MSEVAAFPAFSAFEKQLKTLCLKEFPCGSGSWRKTDHFKEKKKSTKTKSLLLPSSVDRLDSQFTVTLKDYGADHEKMETLQEYIGSKFSPWHLDYSWSQEARELRDISVKSPWIIDDIFVLNYFKSLRIVDKKVTEVDPGILKFKNLEELTLSANYIKNVNCKNLPESLKVLELCANEISDISTLCISPPILSHLGLGYNRISFIGDYIAGDNWPSLLSLDLSHNNLSDLLDVVRKLGTLPKLRNLILQGNPLALIPGYRGYTIDSLRKLSLLDDIRISADEKHHFKGLARRREYILDEAKVTIDVSRITGIPMPEELKNPEEQPEFPIIERTYYVEMMFLEDSGGKGDILQLADDAIETSTLAEMDNQQFAASPDLQSIASHDHHSVISQQERNVYFTSQPNLEKVQEVAEFPESAFDEETLDRHLLDETPRCEATQSKMTLCPIQTEAQKWTEDMELNWSTMQVRDNLLSLRDFFKQGMQLSVVEKMVLCHPLEEDDGESVAGSVKKAKDDKGKADKKGKAPPEPKKDEKKKKKKEPEMELRRSPPQLTNLVTFHLPLEDFLEGEFEIEQVFSQGGVEVASTVRSDSPDVGKKDAKKDKKGSKPPSAVKKDKGGKDTGKTSKGKEADKKDAGKKGKGASMGEDEEAEEGPPPPLEVHISIKLHHWKTAMDSLKEEEERCKTQRD